MEWMEGFNSLVPSIHLTSEVNDQTFTLLDVTFTKGAGWQSTGFLDTSVFQKSMNMYQYIPWKSAHPKHCRRGLIIGELKRYVLRESTQQGFNSICIAFFRRLRARGYPRDFILRVMREVKYSDRESLLVRSASRPPLDVATPRVLPFVSNYHPSLDSVHWRDIFHIPPTLQRRLSSLIPRTPFLSLRAPPSISQRLVRATFTPSLAAVE
jgi:hypothetical protein